MGSLCLIPLIRWMVCVGMPLISKVYLTVVTHSIIQFTHVLLKFMASMITLRKFQLTLSYALHISIFKAPNPFFLPFFFFRVSKISWASRILSMILLPWIKAFWKGEISLSMRGFNLFTRILEMILYVTLHRLIGLKWVTSSWLLC